MIFQRVIYALQGFFRYYSNFKHMKMLRKINTLVEIDPASLSALGIKVLVLDFDGVLASHGESVPENVVQEWLKHAVKVYGLGQIFLLTNNPKPEREIFFKNYFPAIECISSPRKKPYPDGLLKIQEKTNVLPQEMALVDDRLLTGMLACQIAGVQGFWITQPYVNFAKRPWAELGFALLRKIEKLLLI
jgi:predicted HAD superfamily phosphohydrolase YqeG